MRRPSALIEHNRVFHSLYKVGRNGIIGLELFNNSKKKLPPVGLDLDAREQAFACRSETFRSLYSQVLLIIAKSSQFL